jgi:hypothetical protein
VKTVCALIGSGVRRWSVTLTTALALTACGMETPDGPGASWIQVTERTTCEALNPSFCTGIYGFTVMNDGRYTVGPANDGTQVGGSLTDAERSALSREADMVAAGLGGSQQCDTVGTVAGVSDAVDLTDSSHAVSRVYEIGVRRTCYRGGRDRAIQLHDDLRALMARYYPRPFPAQ